MVVALPSFQREVPTPSQREEEGAEPVRKNKKKKGQENLYNKIVLSLSCGGAGLLHTRKTARRTTKSKRRVTTNAKNVGTGPGREESGTTAKKE